MEIKLEAVRISEEDNKKKVDSKVEKIGSSLE
jgi:hypothetical protein